MTVIVFVTLSLTFCHLSVSIFLFVSPFNYNVNYHVRCLFSVLCLLYFFEFRYLVHVFLDSFRSFILSFPLIFSVRPPFSFLSFLLCIFPASLSRLHYLVSYLCFPFVFCQLSFFPPSSSILSLIIRYSFPFFFFWWLFADSMSLSSSLIFCNINYQLVRFPTSFEMNQKVQNWSHTRQSSSCVMIQCHVKFTGSVSVLTPLTTRYW